jgi:hypothetical protein
MLVAHARGDLLPSTLDNHYAFGSLKQTVTVTQAPEESQGLAVSHTHVSAKPTLVSRSPAKEAKMIFLIKSFRFSPGLPGAI